MNNNGEFVYDNDYTMPVEDYILDNSITGEMQKPEPMAEPTEGDVNGNVE
jgi:hypothetical protein